MSLQNFVNGLTPLIGATWLNQIDNFVNTLFNGATTGTAARAAIGSAASGVNNDITQLTGLTTPLAVAEGGTGDTGTQWSTQVVTPTANGGTLTSATATWRFKVIGKTAFYTVTITITTNGTGSTSLNLPMPTGWIVKSNTVASGREATITGKAVNGWMQTATTSVGLITFYDTSYPGSNGANIILSGVLELT